MTPDEAIILQKMDFSARKIGCVRSSNTKKVHLKSAPQEHQVENFNPQTKLSEIIKFLIFNGL